MKNLILLILMLISGCTTYAQMPYVDFKHIDTLFLINNKDQIKNCNKDKITQEGNYYITYWCDSSKVNIKYSFNSKQLCIIEFYVDSLIEKDAIKLYNDLLCKGNIQYGKCYTVEQSIYLWNYNEYSVVLSKSGPMTKNDIYEINLTYIKNFN